MRARYWYIFLLSMMLVSAVGLWASPGNPLASSIYVLEFLGSVLGLIATSFVVMAHSLPPGHGEASDALAQARRDGSHGPNPSSGPGPVPAREVAPEPEDSSQVEGRAE